MKKIFCVLASLLVLAVMGVALAEEASVWEFDTYNFSLDGYTGPGGDVVIPEIIEDCTVDIIGLNAFNSAEGITSLVLPGTLRQIENGAISFCNELTSVTLPEGLLVIGDNCFTGNAAMEEIRIPASVCYIGSDSFDSCDNLRKIVFEGVCPVFADTAFDWLPEDAVIFVPDDQYDAYAAEFDRMDLWITVQPSGENAEVVDFSCAPEQFAFDADTGTIVGYEGYDVRVDVPAEFSGVPVRAIGAEAFMDRSYLCYLTLPDTVEVIGDSAFENCTRLLHIDFPASLKSIGNRAFAGGLQAWNLNLPEGLESIGSEAFSYAVRLSNVLDLPQSLKTIGDRAFECSYWLGEVYIPDSVESIGENAFLDSGVSYVVFEGADLPEMPDSVFTNCNYLADIDLHHTASKQQMIDMQTVVDGLGLTCRVWRMQNPDVDYINDGLDTYENGVLTSYSGEQSHVRPWDVYDEITVTEVGDAAFRGNTFIEYFSVPYNDAFTTIGAEAFADSSLQKIDLFDSVTTINGGAFRNCAQLTELTLPESVSFVGVESLNGCTGLQKLTVLCDPTVLPEDLLVDCPADMEVYAAADATDEQLKYLSKLAGRAFYNPVTRLGEPLPELTTMSCEPLPGEDFWYDSEFARLDNYDGYELNLVLPREIDGVPMTAIGGGLMQRASYGDNYEAELPVVSLVIPETYTEIPYYAFENCETLETVVCYAPIETLADSTFKNCTALREVIFVNGVHSMGEYVFDGCPNLETVYVGPYLENVGEFAFLNEDGSESFSLGACITDPAGMPDVDALLAAVKRDPMPEPEPEPAPVAVPVGAEGEPFFGVWHGAEIVMGSETYSFADFEMVMTLALCEDGRMVVAESDSIDMSLVGDGDWIAWHVENGMAIGDNSVMTIMDDGRLCVDEDGAQMIFVRDPQAAAPAEPVTEPVVEEPVAEPAVEEPAEEPVVEEPVAAEPVSAGDCFETKFVCINADVEGYTVDASMLGGEYSVVFHENGTMDFVVVGAPLPALPWTVADNGNFLVDYYGTAMEVVWTEAGFDMNYFDTMLMHFVAEG